MTKGLPAEAAHAGSRHHTQSRDQPGRVRMAAVNAAAASCCARCEDSKPVKRLLKRRRSITIDGNTLDTRCSSMLAAQTVCRPRRMVASWDVSVARTQLRKPGRMIDGRSRSAEGTVDTRPGRGHPRAPLRARQHPGHGAIARLLPRWRFVLATSTPTTACLSTDLPDAGVHVLSIDYRLAPDTRRPRRERTAMPRTDGRWSTQPSSAPTRAVAVAATVRAAT